VSEVSLLPRIGFPRYVDMDVNMLVEDPDTKLLWHRRCGVHSEVERVV
jgi:hypothetical protein